jgi:hypothetical protein
MIVARTHQGLRGERDRQRRGQARPAAEGSREGDPRARRRPPIHVDVPSPRARDPASLRVRPVGAAAALRARRRSGRDPQGVRRRARRARPAARRRRRDRRRGRNSTHLELTQKVAPERYFEAYIAEQMMVATAVGFQVGAGRRSPRRSRPSSRAPTTSCAWRSSRRPSSCLNGSHAGVSIGEDGPSQMALEDLAEFRALGRLGRALSVDPNQTVKLVEARWPTFDGISYLRSTRAALPTLYGPDEEFPSAAPRWCASPTRTRSP